MFLCETRVGTCYRRRVPNPDQGVLYALPRRVLTVWAVGAGFIAPGTYAIHYPVP